MTEYGYSEDWWSQQVCEWQALFFMSNGATDAWLLERFKGDFSAEDIARLRGSWAEFRSAWSSESQS